MHVLPHCPDPQITASASERTKVQVSQLGSGLGLSIQDNKVQHQNFSVTWQEKTLWKAEKKKSKRVSALRWLSLLVVTHLLTQNYILHMVSGGLHMPSQFQQETPTLEKSHLMCALGKKFQSPSFKQSSPAIFKTRALRPKPCARVWSETYPSVSKLLPDFLAVRHGDTEKLLSER